ncbi:MAG: hypothetical protein U9N35_07455 [Euryarchaeota archaeon]|nr:hypothetical protein [Euryarchaeota archaeon]
MFSNDEILQEVIAIRKSFGFPTIIPEIINTAYDEKKDTLHIVAEDRADKSNIIGYGKVVGELKKRLGVTYVTLHSHLDLLRRREKLTENMDKLKEDPVSIKLKKYIKNEFELVNEEIKFPKNGKSLVIPCSNLYSLHLSKILGFEPIVFTIRLTYPKVARKYESVIIEKKIQDCTECRELTRKKAIEYAKKNDIPIIFGDFDEGITYDTTILLNPTKFFWLNGWKRKNLTEIKDKCMRLKNDIFFKKPLEEVYEGLREPKWATDDIIRYYRGGS